MDTRALRALILSFVYITSPAAGLINSGPPLTQAEKDAQQKAFAEGKALNQDPAVQSNNAASRTFTQEAWAQHWNNESFATLNVTPSGMATTTPGNDLSVLNTSTQARLTECTRLAAPGNEALWARLTTEQQAECKASNTVRDLTDTGRIGENNPYIKGPDAFNTATDQMFRAPTYANAQYGGEMSVALTQNGCTPAGTVGQKATTTTLTCSLLAGVIEDPAGAGCIKQRQVTLIKVRIPQPDIPAPNPCPATGPCAPTKRPDEIRYDAVDIITNGCEIQERKSNPENFRTPISLGRVDTECELLKTSEAALEAGKSNDITQNPNDLETPGRREVFCTGPSCVNDDGTRDNFSRIENRDWWKQQFRYRCLTDKLEEVKGPDSSVRGPIDSYTLTRGGTGASACDIIRQQNSGCQETAPGEVMFFPFLMPDGTHVNKPVAAAIKFLCPATPSATPPRDTCADRKVCMGDFCFESGYRNDTNAAIALGHLEAANEAGTYGEGTAHGSNYELNALFKGHPRRCREGNAGLRACCEPKVNPGFKTRNFTLGTAVATSAISIGWDYSMYVLNPYVSDALMPLGSAVSAVGDAIGSFSVWEQGFKMANPQGFELPIGAGGFTPSLGAYGFSVTYTGFTTTATTATTATAGTTAATAGTATAATAGTATATTAGTATGGFVLPGTMQLGSAGSFNFAFNPYVFAAMIAIMIYQALSSCDEEEAILAIQRGDELCDPVARECIAKWPLVGGCREYAQKFCCFNSRLALAINKAAKMAGKYYPDLACQGVSATSLSQLDWSKIDFSTFNADLNNGIKMMSETRSVTENGVTKQKSAMGTSTDNSVVSPDLWQDRAKDRLDTTLTVDPNNPNPDMSKRPVIQDCINGRYPTGRPC